jgi:hypothetical protein
MPFLFDLDEGRGVFRVQARDEVDDAQLIDLVARLGRDAAYVAGYPILCDCSAATAVSISSGLIESLAKGARSRTNVVAVIAPSAVAFGLARMYQIFSDPEDARIRVFTNATEAMAWLDARVEKLSQLAQEANGEVLRKALEVKQADLNPKPIWPCGDCWSIGLMEIAAAIPDTPDVLLSSRPNVASAASGGSILPTALTPGTERAVKPSHRVPHRPVKGLRRPT